jgi:hypothetical protein
MSLVQQRIRLRKACPSAAFRFRTGYLRLLMTAALQANRQQRVRRPFAAAATGSSPMHSFQPFIALSLALAVFAGGCATVAPYERERLARPDMELGRNANAKAGEEHATAYREGSGGAMGTSGGGCGCN